MEHRSQQLSNTSSAALRQQRPGLRPKKPSLFDAMNVVYPYLENQTSDGNLDLPKRPPWLENRVRRRSSIPKAKGKLLYEERFPENYRGLYSARFSPDEDKFVLAYGAGAIQAWNISSNENCVHVRDAPEHGMPIMCVRFIPKTENKFFAASACGSLFLCGMGAGRIVEFVKEESNDLNSVDCSLDGETAVTVGKDAAVRLYDIHTRTLTGMFCRDSKTKSSDFDRYHSMRLFAVKFHPTQSNVFLTGGWDDCVKVWDPRVKNGCMVNIKGPHICGEAVDVKDTVVVTGSWTVQESLRLWDLSSGRLIDIIVPTNRHSSIAGEFFYCAQYFAGDPSGNTVIVGGSGITHVEVISLCERKIIASFRIQKSVQALATCSKHVIFGGMEGTFRLAAINP